MSEEQLQDLIQLIGAVTTRCNFLGNKAGNWMNSKVNVISQGNNSGNQQNNYVKQNNYVRKITDSGDVYFAKEGLITVFNID